MKLPHKSNVSRKAYNLKSYKAVIITTSQATLDKIDQKTATLLKVGKPTRSHETQQPRTRWCGGGA